MDKFAKRAAIGAVSLLAVSGVVGAIALYRVSSKLQHDSQLAAASPRLAAAISFPSPATVVVADTAPPATPKEVVVAAKQDLASAFGAALGIDPSKVLSHAALPASSAAAKTQRASGSESLDLGPAAPDRIAKLSDRDAKAFDVRQAGGSDPEHKDKQPRERVSFETDLGNPSGP